MATWVRDRESSSGPETQLSGHSTRRLRLTCPTAVLFYCSVYLCVCHFCAWPCRAMMRLQDFSCDTRTLSCAMWVLGPSASSVASHAPPAPALGKATLTCVWPPGPRAALMHTWRPDGRRTQETPGPRASHFKVLCTTATQVQLPSSPAVS